VKFNTAATPSVGETWGPANASWQLKSGEPGWTITGQDPDGLDRILVTKATSTSDSILKGVADAQITAGSSGTVSIWKAGADTGDNVTAHLNWMHGGQNVSISKQVLVKYFADESKWVIIGAECET